MSRLQDTVIDDDEESCPLCIEEFDLSDKNFRPCPCGYQICQFCFNSLKTTYEKSTCPNCRRPYDEKTIQYKIPSAEEFKADQLNKNKKQLAAKRKETEKREVEASSRRNLAGVRVKQQNLVYVIGLVPQIKDESSLLQTLRGPEYFGQYGEIEKIVVSKAKPGAPNQGIGVYVTYARKEDAALCIQTVDGTMNGDRMLRAQFGTTKYCSAFLRGETCQNKNCSFLHETGEDGQNSSLQGEPHAVTKTKPAPTPAMAPPPRPGSTTHSVSSQPMVRQESENSEDRKGGASTTDASALPSSASWANAPTAAKVRRLSQSTSRATPSPQLTHSAFTAQKQESKVKEAIVENPEPEIKPEPKAKAPSTQAPAKYSSIDPTQMLFDRVIKSVSAKSYQFIFSDACLSIEDQEKLKYYPRLIDPQGGAKRRAMQEKDDIERARLEAEAKVKLEEQATTAAEDAMDDENMGAGSLALGGEPEDNPRSSSARGAISRPSMSSEAADQFRLDSRSLTPQQRQQLAQLSGNVQQAPGLQPPTQNTAFEMSDFDRTMPQYSQSQADQIRNHQRNGSRYFTNDIKSNPTRFQNQQQQAFHSSGIQGPPPGLPASGTPPVSGGGMFAHGQNFTNPGFGTGKDINSDKHLRGRGGTGTGPDAKRGGAEHLVDPSIVQARVHGGQNNTSGQGQGLYGGGNQVDNSNHSPLPNPFEPRLHSRVGSFHSRSSTPKIPPGFEIHAHPISSLPGSGVATPERRSTPVESKLQRVVSGTVLPAIPDLTAVARPTANKSQKEIPKTGRTKAQDDETEPRQQLDNQQTDVSLGSPKPRTKQNTVSQSKAALSLSVDTTSSFPPKKPQTKPRHKDAAKTKASEDKASTPSVAVTEEGRSVSTPVVLPEAPTTESPRSATPATTASEQVPGPRPRTLRLTTTTLKSTASSNEQTTNPVAAERSTPGSAVSVPVRDSHHFPHLPASRQHSISSAPRFDKDSRPSTPLSEQSHPTSNTHSRMMSEAASRSSTPPPLLGNVSIVGSAPERSKTKNQLKKERREKAKAQVETQAPPNAQDVIAVPSPVKTTTAATAEVGPIVTKQKKQKKEKTRRAEPQPSKEKTDVAPPPEPVESAEIVPEPDSTPDSPIDSPQLQSGPVEPSELSIPSTPYTLANLYSDASQPGAPSLAALLATKAPLAHDLLGSMMLTEEITKDHPFLAPLSFTSKDYRLPSDPRKGQDYLDAHGYTATSAFGYQYIPRGQRRELLDGAPIIVGEGDQTPSGMEDLLKTCLIAPSGTVMRHLSSREIDHVLDLEERRAVYREQYGEDLGGMQVLEVRLEGDERGDAINLEGGVEELIRKGEGKGIVWVYEEGEEDDEEDDEEDEDDELDDEAGDLCLGLGSEDGVDREMMGGAESEQEILERARAYEIDDEDNDEDDEDGEEQLWEGGADDADDLHDGRQRMHGHVTRPARPAPPPRGFPGALAAATAASPRAVQGRLENMARERKVNLRALDIGELQRRVAETQKENEASRKEVERLEKGMGKRTKEMGRWRDGLLRDA